MKSFASDPVLSCEEAGSWERQFFGGEESREWPAMRRAGVALARAVLADFEEVGGFSGEGRILVLVGKGHNGGDALIAARVIWEQHPRVVVEVRLVFGERRLRPLAARAWRELFAVGMGRVRAVRSEAVAGRYELCLDGIFGWQFRSPVDAAVAELLGRVNALPIRLRAAVDLPSAGLFQADFTYATGCVKTPVVDAVAAGRVRYLDLGFFSDGGVWADGAGGWQGEVRARVLTVAGLAPLSGWRASRSDKRSFGHVMVVGGSRNYPGAVLMTVLAALRSGVGLVTAFVPETLVGALASRAPEAMWVGWPETPAGGLALEGEHLWGMRKGRASALVLGPGLGHEPETLALAARIVATSPVPLLLDADALRPEVVRAGGMPRIVTPHAGEWARIAASLPEGGGVTQVLKGPVTRVVSGAGEIYYSFFGGPVLARGGSGDLLAGLIGGLLAQTPSDPLGAAVRGVVWQGRAADFLARARGAVAVSATQLLDFLPAALRDSGHEQ